MIGYVYLICEIDSYGGEKYKIGETKNDPEKRLKTLKTGNPNEIFVLRKYSSENYKKIERWFHKKYSSQKTVSKNEFFYLSPEQVISFLNDCKEIDKTITFLKNNNPFYK
jgi:hypothetical protein